MSVYDSDLIIRTGLQAILVALASGIGIISARTVPLKLQAVRKPRNAEEREAVWFHAGIWLFVLTNLFDAMGMVAEYVELRASSTSSDGMFPVYTHGEAATRLYIFSSLFGTADNCCVLLLLSGLGVGVYQVATGVRRRVFDYSIAVLAAAVMALEVLAFLGLQATTAKYVEFERRLELGERRDTQVFDRFSQVQAVTMPLLLGGAVATLWFSCVACREAKRADLKLYRKLVRLLIGAATMYALIRAWGTTESGFRFASFGYDCPSGGVCGSVIDVPINRYGTFIVLVLLFAVEHQKVNGLWTAWRDPFRRGNVGGRDIELESN